MYDHHDEGRSRERVIRADERGRARASRTTTVRVTTAVVTILSGFFAVVLGLHILFELLDANSANPLVTFVRDVAQVLVIFFRDLFTPDYHWARVLLNYGLAALFWLAIGQVIVKIVRSFR